MSAKCFANLEEVQIPDNDSLCELHFPGPQFFLYTLRGVSGQAAHCWSVCPTWDVLKVPEVLPRWFICDGRKSISSGVKGPEFEF